MSTAGFVGPLEEVDQDDRCTLCGLHPTDVTLHADACPTVTRSLCGVIERGRICLKPEHMPADQNWRRWMAEHEWIPLADAPGAIA